MLKREEQQDSKRMTELDETILFMTRPYGIATMVCLLLALFSLTHTWNDKESSEFVMSALTLGINIIFLVVLYLKAKGIRKKDQE